MNKNNKKPANGAVYNGVIPNTPLWFTLYISRTHKLWAFVSMICVSFAGIAGVLFAYIISRLVDDIVLATDVETQLGVLWYWGGLFVALVFFEKGMWRGAGFSGLKWMINSHATGEKSLYSYLMRHSHGYFSNRFAGAISNKVSNAVDGSARLIERWLFSILSEVIGLIATLYIFYTIHIYLALIMAGVVIFLFALNVYLVKKRRPHVIAFAFASSYVRGQGVDLVTNIAAARQYVRQDEELLRLGSSIDDRAHKDTKQSFMGEWIMVGNSLLAVFMVGVIFFMAYLLLSLGLATAGSLVLVLILIARVTHTFNMIGNILNGLVRLHGQIAEGLEEILIPYEIVDTVAAQELLTEGGKMEWKDVVFEYDENRIFDNFNITIEPGQRVGLVGPSGAGKTTFVSLLLRQHDIHGGSIMIDDQDISTVTQDSLRKRIAIVPQEPLLFHRSIRENIAYGKAGATQEEIELAAKRAQAHDFIVALPEGYDTEVGERGVKLSGGQKQRVAIARAMLKESPLLVLDEATSALDSESEVAIQNALHELMDGKTVVAIAHRLSTLREMDRILVLEDGKIVEDGTHKSLTKAGGTYARLWNHQAGGFLQEDTA